MPSVLKRLEDEAMTLPPRSRARLARRLIASLDPEPVDSESEKLWADEAQRRAAELANGELAGIPVKTVFTKARAALW